MPDLPTSIPRTANHWRRGGKDYGWPDVLGVVDVEVWWPLTDLRPAEPLWPDDSDEEGHGER